MSHPEILRQEGEDIVNIMNYAAVDAGGDAIVKVEVTEWAVLTTVKRGAHRRRRTSTS